MPYLTINGAKLHYTDKGEGPETVLFAHGLLFSGEMFDAQVGALSKGYRCVTFDHRGQGRSEVTDDGYDMDTLTEDAAQLIRALDISPCHFVGLSMGGMVGMRLALRHPDRIKSLTLIDTSADDEPRMNHLRYGALNLIARWFGLGVVVGSVMPIMFGSNFLNDKSRDGERERWKAKVASGDRIGITRAVKGVTQRASVSQQISNISVPTLILVGEEDVATPPIKSDRIHAAIAGSKLVSVPRAGHSATIEQPEIVTQAIADFLSTQPSSD